jgi:uncharacterized protein (DUF1330 family)
LTVTVIALITVNQNEPEALKKYIEVTTPLIKKAKANIVQRLELNQPIVGDRPSQSVVIVEYPDMEAVNDVFHSKEYEAIERIRERAFSFYSVSTIMS